MMPTLSPRPDAPPQHAATDSHAAVEGAPPQSPTRRDLGVRVAGIAALLCAVAAAGSFASRRSIEPPNVGPFHGNASAQPSNSFVAPPSPRHAKVAPKPNAAPTTLDSIVVHVAGQVKRPGVYTLPATARVQDALLKAGGALPSGDPDALNLAAHPEDGEKIIVPPKDTASDNARETATSRQSAAAREAATPPRNRSTTRESSTREPLTTRGKNVESGADAAKNARQTEKNAQLDALRSSPVNLNTASETQLQTLPGIGPAMASRILDYRAERGRFSDVDDLDNVKGIGPKKLEKLRPFVIVR